MITGKPYSVRALINVANNPMVTQANTKVVYKALKSLDLYVVTDYWLTPSADIADYVLPVASWMERPFLYSIGSGVDTGLTAGDQGLPSSIPGEYDHKNDYEIFRELAIRLGFGEYFPWKTLEESFDYRLKRRGITFREFLDNGGFDFPFTPEKRYLKQGFATATGKIELYSTVLERLGYDPLPQYEEPRESPISTPELAKEYPLILMTGPRFKFMHHSEMRNIEAIRHHHPDPLVQMHPDTAMGLSIKDGDWVWIETRRGRIRMRCKYFDGLHPQVVSAEHGWWFPELPGEEPWLHGVWESNIGVVLDDDPDVCNPKGGGWPLKALLCKIYRCHRYGESSPKQMPSTPGPGI
jgi:anaerobic selenocysteine-containing dehydrogenase